MHNSNSNIYLANSSETLKIRRESAVTTSDREPGILTSANITQPTKGRLFGQAYHTTPHIIPDSKKANDAKIRMQKKRLTKNENIQAVNDFVPIIDAVASSTSMLSLLDTKTELTAKQKNAEKKRRQAQNKKEQGNSRG